MPENLKVVQNLDECKPKKEELNIGQWENLTNSAINGRYKDFHKIYTDASKQKDGSTGIGITTMRTIRSFERVSNLFQITNAELVAVLKGILAFERLNEKCLS